MVSFYARCAVWIHKCYVIELNTAPHSTCSLSHHRATETYCMTLLPHKVINTSLSHENRCSLKRAVNVNTEAQGIRYVNKLILKSSLLLQLGLFCLVWLLVSPPSSPPPLPSICVGYRVVVLIPLVPRSFHLTGDRFRSVQSLDRCGRLGDVKDESAEILFCERTT